MLLIFHQVTLERLQLQLIRYRNRLCVVGLLTNALLVSAGLVLQLNNDILRVAWPCGHTYIDPLGWILLLALIPLLFCKVLCMFLSRVKRLVFYLNKSKTKTE